MTKFVVICQGSKVRDGWAHPLEWIGWIDDNRSEGGRLRVDCHQVMQRAPSGHRTYRFVCPVCAGTRWERDDGAAGRSGGGVLGEIGIAPDGGRGEFRKRRTLILEHNKLGAVLDLLYQHPERLIESLRDRGLTMRVRFPRLPKEIEALPNAEQLREEFAEYRRLQCQPPGMADLDFLPSSMDLAVRYVITFELLNRTAAELAIAPGKSEHDC